MKTFRELSPLMRFLFGSAWLLTLTMLIVVLVLYTDNKRTKECLADYIVEDRRSSAVRVEAGLEANEAETVFFIEFNAYVKATGPAKAKKLADAVRALDEVARAKTAQKDVARANPVPEVPTACGGKENDAGDI